MVFGSQALASLSAVVAIEMLGWETLNLITLPLLLWVLWSMRKVVMPQRR
jgi:hypothetical protein